MAGMTHPSGSLDPILCAPILRKVDAHLLELLGSLAPDEWDFQTIAPLWQVRDVAAHLLDTALRKLSTVRDSCCVDTVDIRSPRDVVDLVNRLNREGVTVYRRLSPPVLIDMMRIACEQNADFHESLDPYARAAFAVSWAGEESSLNWFDTARELTERWHHQQQIRLATDRSGIMTPELYHPVLDCFLRGLPHAYRNVDAPAETILQVNVTGECGGQWFLLRDGASWILVKEPKGKVTSQVTIPQEVAWRIFTKGIDHDLALAQTKIEGNQELGAKVLNLTSVVA
jgi:uncharacterized protein (TIGR03083 family)